MKNRLVLLFVALAMLICLSGCACSKASLLIDGKEVPVDTVFTLDGNDISLFEYRYYYNQEKKAIDSGNDSYWEEHPEIEAALSNRVLSSISYAYAMRKYADDLGIKLSFKDNQEIKKAESDTKAEYPSNGEYKEYLESQYLNAKLYNKVLTNSKIASMIYERLFGTNGTDKITDLDVYEYVRENYIRYKMIYIKLDYDGTTTNRNLAAEILKKLENGESFDDLISTYSRDMGSRNYPNGYYVNKENDSETLRAISALETGEYTKNYIETTDGYYIFKRMNMQNSDLRNDVEMFRNLMEGNFIDEKVNSYMAEMKKENFSEYYDLITINTLFY